MTRMPKGAGINNAAARTMVALTLAWQFQAVGCEASAQTSSAVDASSGAAAAAATQGTDVVANLRRIKLASSRAQRAVLAVINDVGQTPVAVDPGDPRFFEPSEHQIAEDPTMWEKDFAKFGGFQQPHKKWIDADVAHLKQWIDTLNSEMATVVIPANKQAGTATEWDPMNAEVKDINLHLGELQTLTPGPKYDNMAIAKAALAIYSDLQQFEKHWKSVVKTCSAR